MLVILLGPIFGNRIYAERVTLYLVECAQPAGWWPGTCLRRLCPGDCAAFLKLVMLLQDVFRTVLGHALFYHCQVRTKGPNAKALYSFWTQVSTISSWLQEPILLLTEFNYQPITFQGTTATPRRYVRVNGRAESDGVRHPGRSRTSTDFNKLELGICTPWKFSWLCALIYLCNVAFPGYCCNPSITLLDSNQIFWLKD